VVLGRQAEFDISRRLSVLSIENAAGARKLGDRYARAFQRLSEHPLIGKPALGGKSQDLIVKSRHWRCVIRYRIVADMIFVTRIWHGREEKP
jgi:plasmid stabilization system protein ParE